MCGPAPIYHENPEYPSDSMGLLVYLTEILKNKAKSR